MSTTQNHIIATEVSLQQAFDRATNMAVKIFYPTADLTITPRPYIPMLYPINGDVLATYLTQVADACPTSILGKGSPVSKLDKHLRELVNAAEVLNSTWYPVLYDAYPPGVGSPPVFYTPQVGPVSEKYFTKLGIKRNFTTIFNAIPLIIAMAEHTSRENGVGIAHGIYLDELERWLHLYLNHLAALQATVNLQQG